MEPFQRGTQERPSMTRRACDQCRVRKVACDQGSPCSNCDASKLTCTHSARLPKVPNSKQRVLISTQYERKLDDIAKSVGEIKLFLDKQQPFDRAQPHENITRKQVPTQGGQQPIVNSRSVSRGYSAVWDQPSDIVAFLDTIVAAKKSMITGGTQEAETIASMENLSRALKDHAAVQPWYEIEVDNETDQRDSTMPPLDAVVRVLRWAKSHNKGVRIEWLCHMLPLQTFFDICQKVYFAIEDYTTVDMVLANGFLAIAFSEYAISAEHGTHSPYWTICRRNMYQALRELPLILPASIEATAALAMGAYFAVEESRVALGWTLISAAADFCTTMGLCRPRKPNSRISTPPESSRESLFWTVHRIEKGLALRLARPSNIRDSEIGWSLITAPRFARAAMIQGEVYEKLYSPSGLARSKRERGAIARNLAVDLQKIIAETNNEIVATSRGQMTPESRTLVKYLQCEAICDSTLVVMILRALPPTPGSASGIADECIMMAREVLEVHHQRIVEFGESGDASMLKIYLRWGIMHIPFVAFSVLYSRLMQSYDIDDLVRLERFTTSLRIYDTSAETAAHPCRVYEILCAAARLHYEMEGYGVIPDQVSNAKTPKMIEDVDFDASGQGFSIDTAIDDDLGDWFLSNQQIMSFLDEAMML